MYGDLLIGNPVPSRVELYLPGRAGETRPWIRGWGPDYGGCHRTELREQIARDLKAAAAVYG